MGDEIVFDNHKAEAFRAAYKQALADGQEVFVFEGKEVLTSYAKYLCEFFVMKGYLPKEH